ncbi:MAG: hypothetical protein M3Z09_18295, partial [Acidobacteriota bacterium]|nr:hypothetical protein [Acidobacteriota bacterium]
MLALAAAACAVRLFNLHLAPVFPAVSMYLVLEAVSASLSILVAPSTRAYAWVYLISSSLMWLVSGWAIREFYADIFSDFPGLAYLGRWSIYIAASVTAVTSALTIAVVRQLFADEHTLLIALEFAGHFLSFGFAVLTAFLLFMISRYPLSPNRNVVVNCLLFSGILLGEGAGFMVDFFTARMHTLMVGISTSLGAAACFGVWCFLLSPQGQTQVVRIRRHFSPSDEHRLMDQLNAI